MTWTYATTGPFGSATTTARRNSVRRLIGDTATATQLLSDEEIKFTLDQEGDDLYRAAATCCLSLADAEAVDTSVGDLSIGEKATGYKDLARLYMARSASQATPFAGGISADDKETRQEDTDRVAPAFTRSLHNTPGIWGSTEST